MERRRIFKKIAICTGISGLADGKIRGTLQFCQMA